MAAGLVTAILAGGSAASIWVLINLHQLLEILPLLNTYIDEEFLYYVLDFELFTLNFEFTSFIELPKIDLWFQSFDFSQVDILYEESGFESGSFVVNYYEFLRLLFIFITFDI